MRFAQTRRLLLTVRYDPRGSLVGQDLVGQDLVGQDMRWAAQPPGPPRKQERPMPASSRGVMQRAAGLAAGIRLALAALPARILPAPPVPFLAAVPALFLAAVPAGAQVPPPYAGQSAPPSEPAAVSLNTTQRGVPAEASAENGVLAKERA